VLGGVLGGLVRLVTVVTRHADDTPVVSELVEEVLENLLLKGLVKD
jgi:hypothetical protein